MSGQDLRAAFERIPQLRDKLPADFVITPLAGLTNRNFRLQGDGGDWVLRLPRMSTNAQIDREAESHNQQLAAGLGIAPRPVWRDASGYMLTATLLATRPATAADFDNRSTLKQILEPVRRLHRSAVEFRGRVEPGAELARYYAMLDESARQDYQPRMRLAQQRLSRLQRHDADYVPSHNDLVLENLLGGSAGVQLIDWEFSSMASPYWDLATLCNSARLDDAQAADLLHLYCADGAVMEESLLFDYRELLQLLTDCWMAALSR